MKRSISTHAASAALMVFLSWTGLALSWSAGGAHANPVVEPELWRAVALAPVRVLVELRLSPAPDPRDAAPGRDAQRRQAIAAAQSEVLARLAGTRFTLVRRYAITPALALEVGADALAALGRMGDLVASVREDTTVAPAPPGSAGVGR